MQTLNPTSESRTVYDPNVALEFFKLFGSSESVKQEEVIFAQGQKAKRLLLQYDKMYLLVSGKVNIQTSSKEIISVKPGEIFGELTPLTQLARSASAVAETPCKLVSLNERQLRNGLKQKPEFALVFMLVLVKHLRNAVIQAKSAGLFSEDKDGTTGYVFDSKMRAELIAKMGDQAIIQVPQQRVIFQEGGTGMLMYVVLEGSVVTSIDGKVVERSGKGGVIGEIALVDQKRRVADVIAETSCLLLAINRHDFLNLVKTQPSFGLSLLRALAIRLYACYTGYSYPPPHSLFSGF